MRDGSALKLVSLFIGTLFLGCVNGADSRPTPGTPDEQNLVMDLLANFEARVSKAPQIDSWVQENKAALDQLSTEGRRALDEQALQFWRASHSVGSQDQAVDGIDPGTASAALACTYPPCPEYFKSLWCVANGCFGGCGDDDHCQLF